jgi:phenylalanyl-tRNA synthetase alpha chain
MRKFPKDQYEIFMYLDKHKDFVQFDKISKDNSEFIKPTSVAVFAKVFGDEGLVEIQESSFMEYSIKPLGKTAAESGFPERRIADIVFGVHGKCMKISEIPDHGDIDKADVGKSLKWLGLKNLGVNNKGTIFVENAPQKDFFPDEQFIIFLAQSGQASKEEILNNSSGLTQESLVQALSLLKGRESWFSQKNRKIRTLRLTPAGKDMINHGIETCEEVGQLTSDLISSGQWRNVILKSYDVELAAEEIETGRYHPFMKIIDQSRRVFLEMGFDEICSPHVESGFWDFDVLFQPQDHPAREMQDTFFLSRPAKCSLPDQNLVDRVKDTHENGGSTGSVGWCYKWSSEKARQAVLRTHTTAATVRALASSSPDEPKKVFCVGRVFRRETIDYKHLPVFYQIDGIIIDEKASFANLLGTLKAFYSKMGFSKFQFRPAFFPYTEPSVEVFVWHQGKKDWIEMGGAGIFRPEVTEPLGCKSPVLAWGLGLERLAMFRYELSDIRNIYLPDLKWLREVQSCQ